MERMPLIPKRRTFGEISLSAILVLLAIGAASSHAGLHAGLRLSHGLFSLCSVLAVVAINMRFDARPIAPTPLVIDGKPNYNYGPIKFASLAALFWERGFVVGCISRSNSLFPRSISIFPGSTSGDCAVAHLGGDLRLRGNVLLATSFYVVQRTSRRASRGNSRRGSCAGYNFFILIAGTGYLLGITRSHEYANRMVCDPLACVVWSLIFSSIW